MALVVLLRGVNVGGHRVFRPTALARRLKHLDAVNIGAAGTFVIRRPVTQTRLRAELKRWLPFDTDILICQGREITRLMRHDAIALYPERPGVVGFVSVLSRRLRAAPRVPMTLPSEGRWLVRVLACDGRFVIGQYRRQMKAIGCLGKLDDLLGAPLTTRNWNTMKAIAELLDADETRYG